MGTVIVFPVVQARRQPSGRRGRVGSAESMPSLIAFAPWQSIALGMELWMHWWTGGPGAEGAPHGLPDNVVSIARGKMLRRAGRGGRY